MRATYTPLATFSISLLLQHVTISRRTETLGIDVGIDSKKMQPAIC